MWVTDSLPWVQSPHGQSAALLYHSLPCVKPIFRREVYIGLPHANSYSVHMIIYHQNIIIWIVLCLFSLVCGVLPFHGGNVKIESYRDVTPWLRQLWQKICLEHAAKDSMGPTTGLKCSDRGEKDVAHVLWYQNASRRDRILVCSPDLSVGDFLESDRGYLGGTGGFAFLQLPRSSKPISSTLRKAFLSAGKDYNNMSQKPGSLMSVVLELTINKNTKFFQISRDGRTAPSWWCMRILRASTLDNYAILKKLSSVQRGIAPRFISVF